MATRKFWKRWTHLRHLLERDVGSLFGSNGGSGGRSVWEAIDSSSPVAHFVVVHSCLEQVIHFTYSDSGTWSMLCSVRIALQMNSVPALALCMFTQAHHFQLSVFTRFPGTRLQNIVLISLEQGQFSVLSVV